MADFYQYERREKWRSRKTRIESLMLITVEPREHITLLPPNSGVVGRFLEEAENMFKARAMRIAGLLRRLDESGRTTEQLWRQATERMEASEAALGAQFRSEGLLPNGEKDEEMEGPD